jgi:predicted short-subunit dehydrogenase-like oxidoreductase (DUF2520 family)
MNEPLNPKPSVVIVGCGRVGSSLAVYLSRAGYRLLATVSHSAASAEAAGRRSGATHHGTQPWRYTPEADIVLITTPDAQIEPACRQIADRGGFAPDTTVLHCSGALPSTVLEPARGTGAAIGSLHPLQSFATAKPEVDPFSGIIFAVEGDPSARQAAASIAAALGGKSLPLKTEGKALYHAAAVVASNYLVAIADMALCLLDSAGIDPSEGMTVLGPLIHGTLGNIERLGAPASLTGPIARGDRETIRRHQVEIQRLRPELAGLYAALGRHTVDVALRGGHIPPDTAECLSALFRDI